MTARRVSELSQDLLDNSLDTIGTTILQTFTLFCCRRKYKRCMVAGFF